MAIKKEEEISYLLQDLLSLESYLKNLLDFFPLPTSILTPLGVILEFNPAFEKISGYKAAEVIGEHLSLLFDKKIVQNFLKETIEKRKISEKEVILYSKKGEKIPVSLFSKARILENKISGIFLSLYDLRKIKKAQEELKEAQIVLEIRVRARTREAREKVESLEEEVKLRTKELEQKIKQLEKFYVLTRGREGRLKELEKENETLKRELLKIKTLNKI